MNPRDVLRIGAVIRTLTLGRVRIEQINRDEVHCRVIGRKTRIVLSRAAALRRFIEPAKRSET
jgi:hypothetical protein